MPSGVRSAPFALDASLCIRCLRQSRGPRNGPAKSLTRSYQSPLQNPRPFSSTACRAADTTTINNAETLVEKPESRFPEPPPKSGITHLTNRRLIELKGSDAAKFLQGLTTNNVDPHKTSGWYSAFLSAQGRVLWEGFIYPWATSSGQNTTGGLEAEWSCLVEVEKTQVDALVKHLKRHKLRSKVEVRGVEEGELDVWAAWMDNGGEAKDPSPSQIAKEVAGKEEGEVQDNAIHLPDPRVGGFGHRFLLSNNTCSFSSGLKSKLPPAFQELRYTPLQSYTLRRYQWGIPEGSKEIIPDTALPMESSLDYMSAIDFRKGCYVGQELTIRTRHTGVIRKRILPVQMYGFESDVASTAPESWMYSQDASDVMTPLQPGLDIKKVEDGSLKKGRSAGKYLTGIGNVGLALVRLEMMTDVKVSAEGGSYQPGQEFGVDVDSSEGEKVVKLKAFVPEWHRQREAEREAEKAKKPKREE